MIVYVQWTQSEPQDWVEINLASNRNQWRQLASKAEPQGGETLDQNPGWIMAVNVQGVIFAGFDHYAGEFVQPGGLRVYGWSDDPEDQPPERFAAHVWTFLPLAPDNRFGGRLNTRQSCIIYAAPEVYAEIASLGPIENTTLRPWSEWAPPAEQITKHGIWAPDDLLQLHKTRRAQHHWEEWTA